MRKVLVASSKGGCGKSTVATQLAAAWAQAGKHTALVDLDPQQSSFQWCRRRPPTVPGVLGLEGTRRNWGARLPADTQRVVIDTPAGTQPDDIEPTLDALDAILVPVLPSPFDLEASERFLQGLVGLGPVRRGKLAVGLVANRLKPWTSATQAALERMRAMPVPVVAELRDSSGYVMLAGLGKGVFDFQSEQARGHQDDWAPLLRWLKKGGR
jgi:chromosome partitioning protein